MPAKHLYEYAVIRIVPRVEREEFMNVGVILFSKQLSYLNCFYLLAEDRLLPFVGEAIGMEELQNAMKSIARICHGSPDSGPIGCFDAAARFRWLTATRSTVIQTSKVHAGFCDDLDVVLEKLFSELVLV